MKKVLVFVALLGIMISVKAQTSPLQKTPQTLAQEMLENMLQHVELTAEQQMQITTTATTYFFNLRSASQASPKTRTALSEVFKEDLKDIMTERKYEQWESGLQQQRQQRMSNNMSNQ